MPSEYIGADDYAEYGLTASDVPQIRRASALVNTYLNREEGLVWVPDAFGRPAYMAAPSPTQTYSLQAAISPGASVVVAFPFPSYDLVGEIFILDRADPTLCEPVSVVGVDVVNNTITLTQVLKAHAAGAPLESGLVISEERKLPSQRSIAQVSRPQLVGLLSASGRYGFGRRSDQFGGYANEMNMLASLQTLGAQQTWQPIDVNNVSISPITGECWITPGLLLAYFSEVRLRYVAGFPASAIPTPVKQATFNIFGNLQAGGDASPIFKVVQAGGTRMERFSGSFIDDDTASMLSSFKTRLMA